MFQVDHQIVGDNLLVVQQFLNVPDRAGWDTHLFEGGEPLLDSALSEQDFCLFRKNFACGDRLLVEGIETWFESWVVDFENVSHAFSESVTEAGHCQHSVFSLVCSVVDASPPPFEEGVAVLLVHLLVGHACLSEGGQSLKDISAEFAIEGLDLHESASLNGEGRTQQSGVHLLALACALPDEQGRAHPPGDGDAGGVVRDGS